MLFKMPILKQEVIKDNIKKNKEYINFNIDVSLASQMRYETKFPELAKNEDLYNYSIRIMSLKDLTISKILSEIKLLYCWIETDIEFIDFVKLFNFTDEDYIKELVDSLKKAFDLILNSSAEKN